MKTDTCEVQDMEQALSHWQPQALLTIEVDGERVRFEIDPHRQDPTIIISTHGCGL